VKKVKLVLALVLIALLITILIQNAWQAQMQVLFWRMQLPGTVLILVALLVGFGLGLAAPALWRTRKPQEPTHEAKKT